MNTHHATILDVSGMSCRSCVRHINDALRELDGVEKVVVRMIDGKVLVRHGQQKATTNHLIAALREAGYESALGTEPACSADPGDASSNTSPAGPPPSLRG